LHKNISLHNIFLKLSYPALWKSYVLSKYWFLVLTNPSSRSVIATCTIIK
jgi:hypothetical protein